MSTNIVQPFNRDALFMLPRDRAAQVAHTVLEPINNLPGHEQAAAFAVLFAALCSRFNLEPEELHALGRKMLRDPAGDSGQRFHRKGNSMMDALVAYANLQKKGTY